MRVFPLPSDNCCRCDGGTSSVQIHNLRYSAATSIIVIRGKETGTQGDAMKEVCQRVLTCGQYAGQEYSYADDQIWRVAHGQSTGGTPSMWREWNMAHHMTRVVRDLGSMAGITFPDGPVSALVEQGSLFPKTENFQSG
jgi:Beta protein